MVGPFIFIDHMGPSVLKNGFDIGPHPHIGLSTLTYLFEGEVHHRDSLGNEQIIRPGGVNWMTAGRGIVHSERTPSHLRGREYRIHGYQIWVALPKDKEDCDPSFFHLEGDQMPRWKEGAIDFTLIAGEALKRKSAIPVHSRLYMINAVVKQDTLWSPRDLYGETAICLVKGGLASCGELIKEGSLLVAKEGAPCELKLSKGSHFLVFGGEPFPESRHIWWNFVSTSNEKIEQAKENWKNDNFPKIPGETGRISLPQ
jgi:redox-sensitive bicupin YhaK (pirin superfamily)